MLIDDFYHYQFATPPLVIHILVPLITHSSPFFSALVFAPLTSDPAPGSVTQYACNETIVLQMQSLGDIEITLTHSKEWFVDQSSQIFLLLFLVTSQDHRHLLKNKVQLKFRE